MDRTDPSDVTHPDALVTKFCILTESSPSIALNAMRQNATVLPARRESIKPLQESPGK